MGRKPRGVKGYTPEQIKELFTSDDKYKIGLRLYAVYQVSLGKSSREVAPPIQHQLQANSQLGGSL